MKCNIIENTRHNLILDGEQELIIDSHHEELMNRYPNPDNLQDPMDELKWTYDALIEAEYSDTVFILRYDPVGVLS